MIRDRTGHLFKQTEALKYLGSVMNAKGGCEQDVKNRIEAAWQKWKDLASVLCDAKMPKYLNEKNYDSRCQRISQSRMTEETMGRHNTTRRDVFPIKKEHTDDRKKWRGRIRVADP